METTLPLPLAPDRPPSAGKPHPHVAESLPSPHELRGLLPASPAQARLVQARRQTIRRIVHGEDRRLLAIVGPCSIHDVGAGLDFARRLAGLARELEDRMVLVLRAYFEKPRTTTGWKGLLLDPHLDGSGDAAHGLRLARQFLRDVLDLGVATATEFLEPMSPAYLADLVCWAAIGARTSESPTHRQLASGLSMPVGFKNGTSGGVDGAVNALCAAAEPHTFFGIREDGRAAVVRTAGNRDCHLVLRGGSGGPNFGARPVAAAAQALARAGVNGSILIDCSHDNSGRRPERQIEVAQDVAAQRQAGSRAVIGLMLESNLCGGRQSLDGGPQTLRYGQSITDPCLDWETTAACLRAVHAACAAPAGRDADPA